MNKKFLLEVLRHNLFRRATMRERSISFLVAFYVSLFLISCFLFVSQGFAAPVLDQSCDHTELGLNSQFPWQQEVNVGVKGELVGISLYLYPNTHGVSGGIIFFLNKGSGWQIDANDYESAVSPPTSVGWHYIDLSTSHLMFDIGAQFVIVTKWDNSQYPPMLGANDLNAYLGGQLYANGVAISNQDLAFKTYIEPAPVPIPGAAWLLGSGLIGIFGIRRKFKKWASSNFVCQKAGSCGSAFLME